MIDTPQIIQIGARHTAIIPLTIPKSEMRLVMGPGLAELMGTIAAQGVKTAGPWFTHHLRIEPNLWDFEISIPVETPIVATGRVTPRLETSMTAIRTVYHGPYEGLGDAWSTFLAWIATEGHTTSGELWECYIVGPNTVSNSDDFRTELTKRLIE